MMERRERLGAVQVPAAGHCIEVTSCYARAARSGLVRMHALIQRLEDQACVPQLVNWGLGLGTGSCG